MKALFSLFTINLTILSLCLHCISYKAQAKKNITSKKIDLAQKYFKKKQCSKMIALLNDHTSSLNSVWLKKMAYCFKKTHNLTQEQNIYTQLLANKPEDYFSHFTLARLYQKESLQKTPQPLLTNLATKHFRLTIKIKKAFIPAYNALFKIFKKQKNYYEIQVLAENLLKVKKNNKQALINLCFSYFKQDYIEETIALCKKAIKNTKKTPLADNFVYLSLSLHKQKKGSGEKLLLYAEKKFSKSLLVAETLANKYYKEKKYTLSSKYYKKVVALKSKDFHTLENATWSFFKIKKYELSLRALKQLCSVNKQEGVHIARTAISKLEKNQQKKWLSPYKLSLATDCH